MPFTLSRASAMSAVPSMIFSLVYDIGGTPEAAEYAGRLVRGEFLIIAAIQVFRRLVFNGNRP